MWQTLTRLLNKYGENAEGHLYGLLQTLITNLTWFGGFPRDTVDQISEYVQALLDDGFHCRRMRNRDNSQTVAMPLLVGPGKDKNILTIVKISLPRRNVHRLPQKTIFLSECCHQAAVAGGAGLPLLLVLWQAWPWEQQHVGQSPAHQYVSLKKAQGNVSSDIKWGWLL